MLSPKMQRSIRVNEAQLLNLADRAQYDHSMVGKTAWIVRHFDSYTQSSLTARSFA